MPADVISADAPLHEQLKAFREAKGATPEKVADLMDWSIRKIQRIETGESSITTSDLWALLTYYRVDHRRINDLITVARAQHRARLSRKPKDK